MQVSRSGKSEQALQQDLARRRLQQVGAPHDVGHMLLRIVDDDRELVGVQRVAPLEDEIADVARDVLRDAALHAILEDDRFGCDAQALGGGHVGRDRGVAAGSRIDRAFDALQRRVGDLLARAATAIDERAFA